MLGNIKFFNYLLYTQYQIMNIITTTDMWREAILIVRCFGPANHPQYYEY